jgi:hypothetical protein
MSIPVRAKSFEFKPPCLAEREDCPTFVLRYGTRDDRYAYQDILAEQRLRNHTQDQFEAALISEFKADWTSEAVDPAEIVEAMERYFGAMNDLRSANAEWDKRAFDLIEDGKDLLIADAEKQIGPRPVLEFDADEKRKIETLISDIAAASDLLGKMERDNQRFARERGRIWARLLLVECSLVPTLERDRDGILKVSALNQIEDAIEAYCGDFALASDAIQQVRDKALMSFTLTVEETKNSASPLPTTTGDSGSTTSSKTGSTTADLLSTSPEPVGEITPEPSWDSNGIPT